MMPTLRLNDVWYLYGIEMEQHTWQTNTFPLQYCQYRKIMIWSSYQQFVTWTNVWRLANGISAAWSCMTIIEFRILFHWTINLNHWRPNVPTHICAARPIWVKVKYQHLSSQVAFMSCFHVFALGLAITWTNNFSVPGYDASTNINNHALRMNLHLTHLDLVLLIWSPPVDVRYIEC